MDKPEWNFENLEVLVDISMQSTSLVKCGKYDSRAIVQELIGWTEEFIKETENADWHEVDYYEAQERFTNKKLKEFRLKNR